MALRLSPMYRVIVLLLVVLIGWPPISPATFAASVDAQTAPPDLTATPSLDPADTPLPEPIPDPELPSLALSVAVAPDPVVVGQIATVTLTIDNAAQYPAEDLVVRLPLPEGVALSADTARSAAGWEWQLGRLEGQSQATLTTTMPTASGSPRRLAGRPGCISRGCKSRSWVGHGSATITSTGRWWRCATVQGH
jgi:hypothetical protein